MGLSGVCVFVLASISGGYAHHPTLTECHLQMIKGDGVDLNKYYTLGQGQVKKLKLLRLTGEWSGTGQGLSTSCVIVLDDCQFNCICQGRTSAILVQAFNWEKWCVLLPNYITQSQRRWFTFQYIECLLWTWRFSSESSSQQPTRNFRSSQGPGASRRDKENSHDPH